MASWVNRREYPFTDNYIDVDGGRMHYVDEGSGEPIVFVHGMPTWSYLWRNLIRDLGKDHRCVAPDLIGFGLSDKPQEWSYSPAAQARNLAHLIEALNLEDVTLVLHDFGASLGMAYAVAHPANVKRIVVFNSWCWDVSEDPAVARTGKLMAGALGKMMYVNLNQAPKLLGKAFADRAKFTESMQTAYTKPFEQKDQRYGPWNMARNMMEQGAWFDEQWRERHELDETPMQFVWGMKDPTFGEKCLNKWWHEFPLAEVERLDNAGHFPMEEKPFEVLRAVRSFFGAKKGPYLG